MRFGGFVEESMVKNAGDMLDNICAAFFKHREDGVELAVMEASEGLNLNNQGGNLAGRHIYQQEGVSSRLTIA
jgi:hypothetical protein